MSLSFIFYRVSLPPGFSLPFPPILCVRSSFRYAKVGEGVTVTSLYAREAATRNSGSSENPVGWHLDEFSLSSSATHKVHQRQPPPSLGPGVFVTKTTTSVKRLESPHPSGNGVLVKGYVYSVAMKSSSCGASLPELRVAVASMGASDKTNNGTNSSGGSGGGTVCDGSGDAAAATAMCGSLTAPTSPPVSGGGGVNPNNTVSTVRWNVTVRRVQIAAAPPGGNFDIAMGGSGSGSSASSQFQTVSFDASAAQLKDAIQKMSGTEATAGITVYDRKVDVSRVGSLCQGYVRRRMNSRSRSQSPSDVSHCHC